MQKFEYKDNYTKRIGRETGNILRRRSSNIKKDYDGLDKWSDMFETDKSLENYEIETDSEGISSLLSGLEIYSDSTIIQNYQDKQQDLINHEQSSLKDNLLKIQSNSNSMQEISQNSHVTNSDKKIQFPFSSIKKKTNNRTFTDKKQNYDLLNQIKGSNNTSISPMQIPSDFSNQSKRIQEQRYQYLKQKVLNMKEITTDSDFDENDLAIQDMEDNMYLNIKIHSDSNIQQLSQYNYQDQEIHQGNENQQIHLSIEKFDSNNNQKQNNENYKNIQQNQKQTNNQLQLNELQSQKKRNQNKKQLINDNNIQKNRNAKKKEFKQNENINQNQKQIINDIQNINQIVNEIQNKEQNKTNKVKKQLVKQNKLDNVNISNKQSMQDILDIQDQMEYYNQNDNIDYNEQIEIIQQSEEKNHELSQNKPNQQQTYSLELKIQNQIDQKQQIKENEIKIQNQEKNVANKIQNKSNKQNKLDNILDDLNSDYKYQNRDNQDDQIYNSQYDQNNSYQKEYNQEINENLNNAKMMSLNQDDMNQKKRKKVKLKKTEQLVQCLQIEDLEKNKKTQIKKQQTKKFVSNNQKSVSKKQILNKFELLDKENHTYIEPSQNIVDYYGQQKRYPQRNRALQDRNIQKQCVFEINEKGIGMKYLIVNPDYSQPVKNKKPKLMIGPEQYYFETVYEDNETITLSIKIKPVSQKEKSKNISGIMQCTVLECEDKKLIVKFGTQEKILCQNDQFLIPQNEFYSIQNKSTNQISEISVLIYK